MAKERKIIKINTVEELANLAGSATNEWKAKEKWYLHNNNEVDTLDPETGEVYSFSREDGNYELEDPLYTLQRSNGSEITKKRSELFRASYTEYRLTENEYGGGEQIKLSPCLGEKLDKVWTRNPSYPTWRKNCSFTLLSLCKRLGVAGGMEKTIKAEIEKAKAQQEKIARNSQRWSKISRINSMIEELSNMGQAGEAMVALALMVKKIEKEIEA